jgi:HEAT repeat protein
VERILGADGARTEEETQLVLRALAADHESEVISTIIAERPVALAPLARVAPDFPDPEARWQVAALLASPDVDAVVAEPILARLWADAHEYVRRRALLALGDRRSPAAGRCAREAWASNGEYLRIAALHVLARTGDPGITPVLAEAARDRRATVRAAAERAILGPQAAAG